MWVRDNPIQKHGRCHRSRHVQPDVKLLSRNDLRRLWLSRSGDRFHHTRQPLPSSRAAQIAAGAFVTCHLFAGFVVRANGNGKGDGNGNGNGNGDGDGNCNCNSFHAETRSHGERQNGRTAKRLWEMRSRDAVPKACSIFLRCSAVSARKELQCSVAPQSLREKSCSALQSLRERSCSAPWLRDSA